MRSQTTLNSDRRQAPITFISAAAVAVEAAHPTAQSYFSALLIISLVVTSNEPKRQCAVEQIIRVNTLTAIAVDVLV